MCRSKPIAYNRVWRNVSRFQLAKAARSLGAELHYFLFDVLKTVHRSSEETVVDWRDDQPPRTAPKDPT